MAQFNSKNLKKIGVFASGGDAPGMNAAIRAVVRTCLSHGLEVYGIYSGYPGMVEGKIEPLQARAMANIIQRGGTILKTGRLDSFVKQEVRAKAYQNLQHHGIQALVCIGGDGSFRGARALWNDFQIPIVGVPGTIDNDLYGTDYTVGFDTAVNTALESIDRIRDTAASHDRVFIVEVMGRNTGFIASFVGLAGGAEEVFAPDIPATVDQAVEKIKQSQAKGKLSSIIITAEGQKPGRAYDLADQIRKKANVDPKVCILGHVQRGGSPTSTDRILASRMGTHAVQTLMQGTCDVMVGVKGPDLVLVPFEDAVTLQKHTSTELIRLTGLLAL